ncbi:MAG: PAS domain S-box protein [Aggregatilineales bacterium]
MAQRRNQSVEQLLTNLLAQAEQSAPDFFEILPVMLCVASPEGRLLRVNRAFCAELGYSQDDLLATTLLALVHPADLPSTLEALAGLRQGQPVVRFENRCRCADGLYKWLLWVSTSLDDGRIYAVAHDITQKQLDLELRAQANTVRTILESISDAFFALDADWRFTYVNAEAARLLRTSPEALLGRVVWDAFPEAVGSEFYQQYHRVVETGEAASFSAYYPPLAAWFEVRAYPLELQKGVSVYFRDITARRAAEEKLRQREQEFRALAENNPDLIGRVDRDMHFVYLNPALRRQLSLSAGVSPPVAAHEIKLPPATRDYLSEVAREVFASGVERRVEFEVPLADSVRYYEARVVPEFGPSGDVETILTITRNITDRRQAELALRESEALYRAIVESQIDMVCRYHPDATLVYVNDAYCRFFGKTRDELLGTSFLKLVSEDMHDTVRARIAQVVRGSGPEVREFPAPAANGEQRWIQWVDHGITDEHGRTTLIQAVGRDITPLKQAEAALQHKEEQYRLLFENNPVPMWVYEPTTLRFLAVNEAAAAHYGYKRAEFLRMRVTDLMLPEDRVRLVNTFAQLESGRGAPIECRQVRRDGSVVDMEIFSHDIVFEGQPARMALARDVTQRRQLEEQRLYAQTLELELAKQRELTELRERFMSMVSHEFRTPLAVISSSVDIVHHYFDRLPREKIVERMADIKRHVASMTALLDDVLYILRGNAGRLTFKPELVDIVSLCESIVENIRLTDRGQHDLVYEADSAALHIEADPRLLEHIVTNLVTNAIKYSPPGTRVRVTVHALENGALLTVEDKGIGIPASDQPYVFQPFHRARNASGVDGTGLGLSIVKQNVELHGGQISFHSAENQGTTFVVQLPRTVPAPACQGAV